MRHTLRRLTTAAAPAMAVLALVVPACERAPGTADPSASAATSAATAPALPRMVIVRTGGFAGVMQEIDIAPDGSWVYTDKRTAKVERGRLTPAQRQQLARIAADPALAQEARGSAPPGRCADMFGYAITVGQLSFGYAPCGVTNRRALTDELLDLVSDATPM